jgi:elongation of very long chain fatty acids protein 7
MQLVAVNKYFVLLWQVFFVLRKRNDQISALHVIHHGLVPMTMWIGTKFASGNFICLQSAFE